MDDWELIQQYVRSGSQDAFAQIVRRHIGWVRAAALRQVRDAHLADDVAQAVFLALARQAHRLHRGAALSTWLFQVTRYASSTALRAEARRKRHERQAAMNAHAQDASSMTPTQWDHLAGVLDRTVARLRSADRRAVLLRFYEQKTYPQIAQALGVSEEAARKRTDRAIERLREMIGGREMTFSAAALSQGLLAHIAAPVSPAVEAGATAMGLHSAGAVTAGAVSAGGAMSTSIQTLSQGAIHMMNLTRLRIPLAACGGLLLVAVVGVAALDAGPGPVAATQPAPPAAAPAPTAAPVPAPVDGDGSPKVVIYNAFRAAAAGDARGLISRFDRPTPAQTRTLEEVTQIMAASERLADAVKERFGADMESPISRAVGVGVAAFDVAAANEAIDGDRAIVTMDAGPGEITLVRSGGRWKISAEVLRTLNPAAVRQYAAAVPAIDQMTAEVRAGKYPTAESLRQALGGMMRAGRPRPTTATTAPAPLPPPARPTPSAP